MVIIREQGRDKEGPEARHREELTGSTGAGARRLSLRPVRLLRVWISEGLTQANS